MHLGYHELRRMLQQFKEEREKRRLAPPSLTSSGPNAPSGPSGPRNMGAGAGDGYRGDRERDRGYDRERGYDRDRDRDRRHGDRG